MRQFIVSSGIPLQDCGSTDSWNCVQEIKYSNGVQYEETICECEYKQHAELICKLLNAYHNNPAIGAVMRYIV